MIQRKHQMGMLCIASSYETRLHTFVGMVGYYMKDIDEDHFQFVHHNFSGK
jgi:hypothetical protein